MRLHWICCSLFDYGIRLKLIVNKTECICCLIIVLFCCSYCSECLRYGLTFITSALDCFFLESRVYHKQSLCHTGYVVVVVDLSMKRILDKIE